MQQRDTDVLKDLANEFNLSFIAFGSVISPKDEPTEGTLTLTNAYGTALEPAPITPSDEDSAPWQLLSGTIKATYNAQRGLEGDNVVVSPGILSGNTGRRISQAAPRYNDNDCGVRSKTRGITGSSRPTSSVTVTSTWAPLFPCPRTGSTPSTSVCCVFFSGSNYGC